MSDDKTIKPIKQAEPTPAPAPVVTKAAVPSASAFVASAVSSSAVKAKSTSAIAGPAQSAAQPVAAHSAVAAKASPAAALTDAVDLTGCDFERRPVGACGVVSRQAEPCIAPRDTPLQLGLDRRGSVWRQRAAGRAARGEAGTCEPRAGQPPLCGSRRLEPRGGTLGRCGFVACELDRNEPQGRRRTRKSQIGRRRPTRARPLGRRVEGCVVADVQSAGGEPLRCEFGRCELGGRGRERLQVYRGHALGLQAAGQAAARTAPRLRHSSMKR